MNYTPVNKSIPKFQTVIGILFTAATGTFLHFFYSFSGHHPAAALISPVNESIWEHLKLLFFPVLLYTLFEILFWKRRVPVFLWARTLSLMAGMGVIVSGFYTYSGILGTHNLFADIALFIAGILTVFLLTIAIQKKRRNFPARTVLAVCLLILWTALFCMFTFYPPSLALFIPPAS